MPGRREVERASGLALRARNLTVTRAGRTALVDLDLDVPAGATVAVIGPNGAGKSTLFDVATALVEPTRGTVEVLGTTPRSARRRVAYVLQSTTTNDLVPLTVREVVTMGRYAIRGPFRPLDGDDRKAIDRALERMAVSDLASLQLRELSAGQRQRVHVAQGLAQEAELLLLDEPATGVDLPAREAIADALADEVARGASVILTTHDVDEAAQADLVILLANRLVAFAVPEEALQSEPLATAFGGHVHVAVDGTLLVDDPHHHEHARRRG